VPTGHGFFFLAVILDARTRRVVGWSMATHSRADLVLAASDMALLYRRLAADVIHYCDHGSQYTAQAFQERCSAAAIRSSMGSVGDYDNALAEASLSPWSVSCSAAPRFTLADARAALFDFIEIFYNRRRRHSALDYLAPDAFERKFTETLVVV
jgi:putative transposase